MKKIIVIALVALMMVAALAGCTPAAKETASQEAPSESASAKASADATEQTQAAADDMSLQTIKDNGVLVMGMDDSFPPMGFVGEDGKLTGFDVDLATEVTKRMGVELQLQPIDWKAKELELKSGNIDVIWNGYTVTPQRAEQVLLSKPYMQNEQVVVVKAGSDIKTLADLAGKIVAVQDGSSAQIAIAENEELASSIGEQIDFKENVTALLDVSTGQVDALAVDSVVADYYTSKKPGEYVILEETLAPEDYAIGFRKGEQALCDAVETALEEMRADGTFAQISEKWFGRDVSAA